MNLFNTQDTQNNGQGLTLADLAKLVMINQQARAQQSTGPKLITAGNRVLGNDISGQSGLDRAGQGLSQLATNFVMMQEMQKRNQFFKSAQEIMKSTGDVEEKKNLMRQLITQNNGDDYGLGIKEVLWKDYVEPKATPEWKPTTKDEAIEFEQAKAGIKSKALSPSMQKLKAQDTKELLSTINQNKVSRVMIDDAIQASKKVATGLGGKLRQSFASNFNPNDPMLGEWQKIKMVLTDAQLMNTAKTKGAISDREMDLFARAAANDDLSSIPKMMPVFRKLLKFMDSNEASLKNSYIKNYDEDPDEWGTETSVPNAEQGSQAPQSGQTKGGNKFRRVQ